MICATWSSGSFRSKLFLQVDECLQCVNSLNEKLENGVDPNSAEIKVILHASCLIVLFISYVDGS